ncbi:hypothetical protein SDC9_128554 [bioreactor metagenome]|uniref:Uncharacterized protein n=1 Tax=bioreactor metagenome TaxID=1076179 RepID=A0A645CX68_9ZZZZ
MSERAGISDCRRRADWSARQRRPEKRRYSSRLVSPSSLPELIRPLLFLKHQRKRRQVRIKVHAILADALSKILLHNHRSRLFLYFSRQVFEKQSYIQPRISGSYRPPPFPRLLYGRISTAYNQGRQDRKRCKFPHLSPQALSALAGGICRPSIKRRHLPILCRWQDCQRSR